MTHKPQPHFGLLAVAGGSVGERVGVPSLALLLVFEDLTVDAEEFTQTNYRVAPGCSRSQDPKDAV